MTYSTKPFRIPCLALCLTFPLATLIPARAAEDPAFSAQPVAVNQVGYVTGKPKRFTAPKAPDATPFIVRATEGGSALFKGSIQGGIGDFSAFQPKDSTQRYVVEIRTSDGTTALSDPFLIRTNLIQEQYWQAAVDFLIDSRSATGTHPSAFGGSPWRDGTY